MNNFVEVFNNLKNPPKEYSLVPFWFWNDDLLEDSLIYQIQQMKEKGIDEFIIHSRKGRTVEYLTEQWFEKVEFAINYAEKLDMKVWIYDEDNWPSGYAGEKVIKENPNYCAKYLKRFKKNAEKPKEAMVIYSDNDYEYAVCYTKWNPAYSESLYTDLLDLDATKCFIKHTHNEYYLRMKKYFENKTIKGFFVDEPGFYNNFNYYEHRADDNSVVWNQCIPDYFYKDKGYDIFPVSNNKCKYLLIFN